MTSHYEHCRRVLVIWVLLGPTLKCKITNSYRFYTNPKIHRRCARRCCVTWRMPSLNHHVNMAWSLPQGSHQITSLATNTAHARRNHTKSPTTHTNHTKSPTTHKNHTKSPQCGNLPPKCGNLPPSAGIWAITLNLSTLSVILAQNTYSEVCHTRFRRCGYFSHCLHVYL